MPCLRSPESMKHFPFTSNIFIPAAPSLPYFRLFASRLTFTVYLILHNCMCVCVCVGNKEYTVFVFVGLSILRTCIYEFAFRPLLFLQYILTLFLYFSLFMYCRHCFFFILFAFLLILRRRICVLVSFYVHILNSYMRCVLRLSLFLFDGMFFFSIVVSLQVPTHWNTSATWHFRTKLCNIRQKNILPNATHKHSTNKRKIKQN